MNEQRIQVPIRAWYGDEKMELSFPKKLLAPQADRLLVCSSYLSRNDLDAYGPPEKVVPCETWAEVLRCLSKSYPEEAKVALYPYTAIQLPPAGSE